VISHTQLDCDLCLLQNQTSSIELSFSLSTTHGEKGEVQISDPKKTCIPFLFKYMPQKNTALKKKKTGVFKEKTNLVLFLTNFIFLTLPFIFLPKDSKKHSERRAIKALFKIWVDWAFLILLHSTKLREPHIFKEKMNR